MNKAFRTCLLGSVLLVAAPMAQADSLDGLEMDVIGADERPEDAARRIELPAAGQPGEGPSGEAVPSRGGASEARDHGAELGQETAEQARDRQGRPEGAGRPEGSGPPSDSGDNRPDGAGEDNRPDRPENGQSNRPSSGRP